MMEKMYIKYMKKVLFTQKKYMICQGLFIFLVSLVTTILPVIHQRIINEIFVKNDFTKFNMFIMAMAILYLLQCGLSILKDFFQAKTDANIKFQLRMELNSAVSKKKYSEYLIHGHEQVITKYSSDTNVISAHFSQELFNLLEQIAILTLAIYMVYKISVILLISMLFFLIIYYVVNKKIGKILQKEIKKMYILKEESLGCFSENYSNNKLVKIYNLYSWIEKRFQKIYQREYTQNIKTDLIYSSSINVTKFIVNSLVICSWIVCGYYISAGEGTIGDIVALTEYIGLLVSPFFYFGQFNNSLQGVLSSIERFENELAIPSENIDKGKALTAITEITLKNVEYQYKTGTFQLKIPDLNMKKGEIIGLKGESGCGKTTLVNLLMHLYSIDKGTIYFNKQDYKEFQLKDVRRCIGYVPQDSIFFEETIRENLFGDYVQGDIDRLAEELDIYHEIQGMEHGYEYILKKNASNLSGGQKKRIDILRVLLANTDVIIFDEATAMLDKKRRDIFFELIMKLKKDKIIIIITHNNYEWEFFDKIYEI